MHCLSRLVFTAALAGIGFAIQVQSAPSSVVDCTHLHGEDWASVNQQSDKPDSHAVSQIAQVSQLMLTKEVSDLAAQQQPDLREIDRHQHGRVLDAFPVRASCKRHVLRH